MLAAIGQNYLMQIYSKYFKKHKITIAQALLSRSDFAIREKYLNIKNTILALLENDIVPIINENDVVSTEELSFSDNDILASYTAALIKADKFIILTVVDGLYNKDPSNPGAKLIEEVEKIDDKILGACDKTTSSLGLGGMESKVNAAKIATDLGIETIVTNGKTQKLREVLRGDSIGTTFCAQNEKKKSIYYWLLAGSEVKGKIIVDEGAAKAVKNRKSLLFVGLVEVEGDFGKGDTIEVHNQEKEKIAVGLSNYDIKEIKRKLVQPKETLKNLKEVIHCDNLKVL
jgi:glutamate 5-kinase